MIAGPEAACMEVVTNESRIYRINLYNPRIVDPTLEN